MAGFLFKHFAEVSAAGACDFRYFRQGDRTLEILADVANRFGGCRISSFFRLADLEGVRRDSEAFGEDFEHFEEALIGFAFEGHAAKVGRAGSSRIEVDAA